MEGPTFAPNGRVLMFWRETPGARPRGGGYSSRLVSIDITGFNERAVPTPDRRLRSRLVAAGWLECRHVRDPQLDSGGRANRAWRNAAVAPITCSPVCLPTRDERMNIKMIGALGALALLGACSDKPPRHRRRDRLRDAAPSATAGPVPGQPGGPGRQCRRPRVLRLRLLQLSGDARSTLDRQSGWLGRYPQVSVQIAGNCDERGTEEYNLALGQRRANAARDYLVARGVSSARISTISYGKERPTALGDNEEAWAQNRNAITSVR